MLATAPRQHDPVPGVRVVASIAAAEDLDPSELDVPLYEAISPSALNRLLEHGGTLEQLSFQYLGYDVTVYADGRIELD